MRNEEEGENSEERRGEKEKGKKIILKIILILFLKDAPYILFLFSHSLGNILWVIPPLPILNIMPHFVAPSRASAAGCV